MSKSDDIAEIVLEDEAHQAAFDSATEAYVSEQDFDALEKYAAQLDTNFAKLPAFEVDRKFSFAVPNWNDNLSLLEMIRYCDEIRKVIGGKNDLPRDILHQRHQLLNCSFSQNIKTHIVSLVAVKETIQGACRHCFALYHEDSQDTGIGTEMMFWDALRSELGISPVFDAFLQRAWHLNPVSRYFPNQYQPLVKSVRQAALDESKRENVHYADPYNQLQLLNETLKKLDYAVRHTSDPSKLAKLANSQVRVAGAIHIINEKLERKHQRAVVDASIALPAELKTTNTTLYKKENE